MSGPCTSTTGANGGVARVHRRPAADVGGPRRRGPRRRGTARGGRRRPGRLRLCVPGGTVSGCGRPSRAHVGRTATGTRRSDHRGPRRRRGPGHRDRLRAGRCTHGRRGLWPPPRSRRRDPLRVRRGSCHRGLRSLGRAPARHPGMGTSGRGFASGQITSIALPPTTVPSDWPVFRKNERRLGAVLTGGDTGAARLLRTQQQPHGHPGCSCRSRVLGAGSWGRPLHLRHCRLPGCTRRHEAADPQLRHDRPATGRRLLGGRSRRGGRTSVLPGGTGTLVRSGRRRPSSPSSPPPRGRATASSRRTGLSSPSGDARFLS